jgi:uncharacterized damage-inducible protein DinB
MWVKLRKALGFFREESSMHQRDLQLLYDYNLWANQRLLAAAARATPEQLAIQRLSQGSILGTLVHIMTGEEGWRYKCETGVQMAVLGDERLADFPTLKSVLTYWNDVNQAMRAYLHRLNDDDLNQTVVLRNRDGEVFERVHWQPFLHVITHSTQHRAEVAEALTQLGYSPGNLDFEIYLREQAAGKGR